MSMFAAWLVYPFVLAVLCAGLGLLVDAVTGRRLPGTLVIPVGLAATMVVGEFTMAAESTAKLTAPLVVALAVLGAGVSWPWRFRRPEPLIMAVAICVFFVFGAPVLFSGAPTFAGYIKLDDTATWLAMTDRIMEHGRSLAGLEPSSYRATLEYNLAGGYPIGAFIPFGTAQRLVGGDLAWVFQPYLSFLGAVLSLSLWEILGAAIRSHRARAFAAFFAAFPALLFGYALWGGVKEMAAAALVALAVALAPRAVRAGARLGDAVPCALAAAALAAALSPAGMVWLAPLLLVLAVLSWRRLGLQRGVGQALFFAAALVLLSLPVLASGLVPPTTKPLVGSNGEGNLLGPLSGWQVLGIWPSGDFRLSPDPAVATGVLIGLALLALVAGVWAAQRRRAAAPLLYLTVLLPCAVIFLIGSPWAAGKALATASPVALCLALLGCMALLRLDRVSGGALTAAVCGGVLWSAVLAYGGVSLAPYGQLHELQVIGERFANQGPALMTEYNPYGARHFLRNVDGEGASELRERPVPLRGGGEVEKGYSVDTDQLELGGLFAYRTLVLRRSPVRSRPPVPYRPVWRGKYYEVWQRPEGETTPPAGEFLPLGGPNDPSGTPACSEIGGLTLVPLLHQQGVSRIIAAHHAPVLDATTGPFDVPTAGTYIAWLGGSVRGSAALDVDGRRVGEVRHELENEGGFIELGQVRLSGGHHRAKLHFGGADLHPGSGGFPRPETGPLLFVPAGAEAGRLVSVAPGQAGRLCGKPWDWIEAMSEG